MPPIEAVMPQAKHDCRAKELLAARRLAANGFWRKNPPDGQLRQLVRLRSSYETMGPRDYGQQDLISF